MSDKVNKVGPTGQIVMGGVFIVGCIVAILLGMNDLKLAQQETAANAWPMISGKVITSGVRQLRDNTKPNSRDWVPDVSYSYSVDGEQYINDRYSFYSSTQSGQSKVGAQKQADKYKEGGTLQVRVDPNDPANSVIFARKRTPFGSYIAFAVGGAGTLAGIGLIIFGARAKFSS